MDEELKKFRAILNAGIERKSYFAFEEDFMEDNHRCIPMAVRFKLDVAGIKLKIKEWSKFSIDEKIELGIKPCGTPHETIIYYEYVVQLIKKYTDNEATILQVDPEPAWKNTEIVPEKLQLKAAEFGWRIKNAEWKSLSTLQRFALLKLCRPGHENRNFPRAVREFGMA